jgi:c-di-GMP-binding flagellar brake protein YcgR
LITTRKSSERRSWKRYHCDLIASCQPAEECDDRPWPGRIRDLSCGGLQLVSARHFPLGTELDLHVDGTDEQAPRHLAAQVMYAVSQTDGSWLMGCQFHQLISAKDLARLLSLFQDEGGEPPPGPGCRAQRFARTG